MTRLWLIRHGAHDWLGRCLVGRAVGIPLNAAGREQAQLLAEALAAVPLSAIHSSPMQRTVETAGPVAAAQGLPVTVDDALNEIDFGAWTKANFDELSNDLRWERWNAARAKAKVPGGESMLEVQRRIVARLTELARTYSGEQLAIVSHGDVIRAALCWYLGMSLDLIHMLDVAPGGVAALDLTEGAAALRVLKHSEALLEDGTSTIGHLPFPSDERVPGVGRLLPDIDLSPTGV